MKNGKRRTENGKWRTNQFSVLRFPFYVLLLSLLVCSCSKPQINLFADYKEIPVVYGMLDVNADTNFIKITRAFSSTNEDPIDPYEVALIYDSSNYPGKLNAYIEELKRRHDGPFQPTGRRIVLDTITIHNKEAGPFYSPHQLLYYTTEQFNTAHDGLSYRYRLNVIIPNGDTVTAETSVVGGEISVVSSKVTFQSEPTTNNANILFSSSEEASLYEIVMHFHYLERHDDGPMMPKEVSWSYGIKRLTEYEKVAGTENVYRLYYDMNSLFTNMRYAIGNDTVWNTNHFNVVRAIGDFVISISAAGADFAHYYLSAQPAITLAPEYSNVNGGWGLFSSRYEVSKTVEMSYRTQYDLFCEPWGFLEQKTENGKRKTED
ncbi:MAG: DUF4249 family protein [Bacteroidales bacterium]|nr:DUF4249 family protein [Bacteroidales bacterium]